MLSILSNNTINALNIGIYIYSSARNNVTYNHITSPIGVLITNNDTYFGGGESYPCFDNLLLDNKINSDSSLVKSIGNVFNNSLIYTIPVNLSGKLILSGDMEIYSGFKLKSNLSFIENKYKIKINGTGEITNASIANASLVEIFKPVYILNTTFDSIKNGTKTVSYTHLTLPTKA